MPDNSSLPRRSRFWTWFFLFLFMGSFLLNLLLCAVNIWPSDTDDLASIREKHLYGQRLSSNKIAVIRAEGPLVEGFDGYILKQIEKVAKDDQVKGVVVRIDSPGGTIGASEDIHRELGRLVTGGHPRYPETKPKKLVASMGMIAASGGYYIAMPAERVYAEKNTITGSIGVYASLPNVADLAHRNGVKMELIKAGGIKGSGSMFHDMTPAERQPWQDMVDQSYDQFLDVVAQGRPKLTKDQLKSEIVSKKSVPLHDDKGNILKDGKDVEVVRYRADGGSFTAGEALKNGLIDEIGLLEDAVAHVATSAGIQSYEVITFERPTSLINSILGVQARQNPLDLNRLSSSLTPRLWYMHGPSEAAGYLALTGSNP
jgi:protease-4